MMDIELNCPSCGAPNLHHHEVVVSNRKTEDAPGIRAVVDHLSVSSQANVADGFAGRRNDLRIRFSCEQCPSEPWLFIVQHKGTTYLKWLPTRESSTEEPEVGRIRLGP